MRSEAFLCHLSCNRGALISLALDRIILLETIISWMGHVSWLQCDQNGHPQLTQFWALWSLSMSPIEWERCTNTIIMGVTADDSTQNNIFLVCLMITIYSHNDHPTQQWKTIFVLWSKEGTDPQWGLTRAHPSMETIYSTKPWFRLLRQQYGWVGTYLTSPTLELEIGNFFGVLDSTQNDPVSSEIFVKTLKWRE